MKLAGMKSMEEFWEKGFKAMSYEGSELNNEMATQMNQLGRWKSNFLSVYDYRTNNRVIRLFIRKELA
jgi:hypothetical protein